MHVCRCTLYVNIALLCNIGNAHHLQLRDITQNVNKQVVSSENKSRSLTTENVIGLQSIVHKLLDRIMKNDSSELPRYGLKQSQVFS